MCRRTPAGFTVDLLIAAYPDGSTTLGGYVQQGLWRWIFCCSNKVQYYSAATGALILFYSFTLSFLLFLYISLDTFFSFRFV